VNSIILLDNEAVQALADKAHSKHRRVLNEVLVANRRATRALSFGIAVPAAVRVEAGWDRTAAAWAFANQLRIADIPLDARHADAAASIRQRAQVSVADAHLGAAIQGAEADHVTVITSDPRDIQRVAEGRRVDVVAI
jgi:predicted nucleic acid-binding protein